MKRYVWYCKHQTANLANRFIGVEQMLKTTQSNQFIISLLYYLGMLTLDGETEELKQLRFKIPNSLVRKFYMEYVLEMRLSGKLDY